MSAVDVTAARLLVVDDDPKLRGFVQQGLTECGMQCEAVGSGNEALKALENSGSYDLLLLDVMMPGLTGWEFLEELRKRGDETPVIFLTAREGVEERIKGLELGADDYVIKPFEFRELLARIHAVLRRHEPVLRTGDLVVDRSRQSVRRAGEVVDTTRKEFELLCVLSEARGAAVSREELLRLVWGIEFEPGTNVVEVLVARLRRKLDRGREPLIHTAVGRGYYLAEKEAT